MSHAGRKGETEIHQETHETDTRNADQKTRWHRIGAKSKVTIQTVAETESVTPPAGRPSARLQPPKSPLARSPGLKFGSLWTRQSASRIPTEPVRVPKQSTDRQQIPQTQCWPDLPPAGVGIGSEAFPIPDKPPNVRPKIRAFVPRRKNRATQ